MKVTSDRNGAIIMLKGKIIAAFMLICSFFILTACTEEETTSLQTEVIGEWKTSSFTLVEKDYNGNSDEAFHDGVMIPYLQMFFIEDTQVIFNDKGIATFHGVPLDYEIENNKIIYLTSDQFGEMKLVFDLSLEGDELRLSHELATIILSPIK
jgi:hypothetical protein